MQSGTAHIQGEERERTEGYMVFEEEEKHKKVDNNKSVPVLRFARQDLCVHSPKGIPKHVRPSVKNISDLLRGQFRKTMWLFLVTCYALFASMPSARHSSVEVMAFPGSVKKLPDIYWNTSNPM